MPDVRFQVLGFLSSDIRHLSSETGLRPMSRTIPGGIDLSGDTTLAMCLQLTDRLGNVLGFTEHDQALVIDIGDGNGSLTYGPEAAFSRRAIEARSGGRVANLELIGFIDSAGLSEEKILGRVYDGALAKLFLVDWTQPAAGIIWLEIGELDETRVQDGQLTVTFKSLLDRYHTTEIGDFYEAECIHVLGSKPEDTPRPFAGIGCRVQLEPPVWTPATEVLTRAATNAKAPAPGSPSQVNTVRPSVEDGRYYEASAGGTTGGSEPVWNTILGGETDDNGVTWVARQALTESATVLSVSEQRQFTLAYAGDAPDQHYRRGRLVFTSGQNSGLERQIKSQAAGSPDGELTVVTWLSFPFAIEPGDAVKMVVGCDRLIATCVGKFRNLTNFGGFTSFAPTNDEVFKIPKQTS